MNDCHLDVSLVTILILRRWVLLLVYIYMYNVKIIKISTAVWKNIFGKMVTLYQNKNHLLFGSLIIKDEKIDNRGIQNSFGLRGKENRPILYIYTLYR